jgi:hypothetical protein
MSLGLQWKEVKKNEDGDEKEEQNMKKRGRGRMGRIMKRSWGK